MPGCFQRWLDGTPQVFRLFAREVQLHAQIPAQPRKVFASGGEVDAQLLGRRWGAAIKGRRTGLRLGHDDGLVSPPRRPGR